MVYIRIFYLLIFSVQIAYILSDGYDTYTAATYPDSMKDFWQCRVLEPSLVCDPNHILDDINGKEAIEMLYRALINLQETTNCSCTPQDNNMGSCAYQKPKGYTVSVAVLNKVQDEPFDPNDPETRKLKVATFSTGLRNRLYRGQCNDDAFIVLSLNDSTIWTAVGEVMNRKLTPELINSVSMVAEEHFLKKQYTTGILYMIDQYTEILKGNRVTIVKPGSNLPFGLSLWLVIVIGVVILMALVTIVVGIIVCCVRKSKSRGYEMGHERGYNSRL